MKLKYNIRFIFVGATIIVTVILGLLLTPRGDLELEGLAVIAYYLLALAFLVIGYTALAIIEHYEAKGKVSPTAKWSTVVLLIVLGVILALNAMVSAQPHLFMKAPLPPKGLSHFEKRYVNDTVGVKFTYPSQYEILTYDNEAAIAPGVAYKAADSHSNPILLGIATQKGDTAVLEIRRDTTADNVPLTLDYILQNPYSFFPGTAVAKEDFQEVMVAGKRGWLQSSPANTLYRYFLPLNDRGEYLTITRFPDNDLNYDYAGFTTVINSLEVIK